MLLGKTNIPIYHLHHSSRSRKLNSQLERAINEAMAELDHTAAKKASPTLQTTPVKIPRTRATRSANVAQSRARPIRIAPAPPTDRVGHTKNLRNNNNSIIAQNHNNPSQ